MRSVDRGLCRRRGREGSGLGAPPPGGSRRHGVRAMSPGFEKIRLPVMWRTSAHLLPGSMRLPGMRRLLEPPASSWTVPYPGVIRLVRSRTPWPLGSTATGRPATLCERAPGRHHTHLHGHRPEPTDQSGARSTRDPLRHRRWHRGRRRAVPQSEPLTSQRARRRARRSGGA